eukprot:TRINITY_DN63089_c0_g1_i1.p1 TRINITY_DN63089_c0_g1~~TRINITY_DN63089_c0_g1_i1.p1  ORF type:complete len:1081 (+),score=176.54 TRINITY_DN63089_c0_g1_i1:94-3243(+)
MTTPPLLHPRYGRNAAAASHPTLPVHEGADKRPLPAARARTRVLFKPVILFRRSKRTRALVTLLLLAAVLCVALFLLVGVVFPSSVTPLESNLSSDRSLHVNHSLLPPRAALPEHREEQEHEREPSFPEHEPVAILVPEVEAHPTNARSAVVENPELANQHDRPVQPFAQTTDTDSSSSQDNSMEESATHQEDTLIENSASAVNTGSTAKLATSDEQPAQAVIIDSTSREGKPMEDSAQELGSDSILKRDKSMEESADAVSADSTGQRGDSEEGIKIDTSTKEEEPAQQSERTRIHPVNDDVKIFVNTTQPVRADVSALAKQREKCDQASLSIVVLFHNEYESMKTSLVSWLDNGLVDYSQEILFFLNGVKDDREFLKKITQYQQIPKNKRRIYVSEENLPLGKAITKMVDLSSSEYVLLLEKDWKLIEPPDITKSRLIDSKVLIDSGVADLVRHRHRHDPGVPLHALIMHQGREESILKQQANLLCFVHHWQEDPPNSYPGKGIMHRCGGPERNVDEEDVYCTPSKYCQWNNNPGLFRRKWFMDEIGREYLKQYKIEFDQHGIQSPFLDFEYYTNWRSYAWADKNFTIAVGTGLFSHAESEHQYFNTFWYAHYRLETDMEEVRNKYLKNETHFKQLGGVHYDPAYPKPLTMMERYPVEFVRKFQFSDMYTGTIDTQRKMIDEYFQQYQRENRVLSEEEWKRSGSGKSGIAASPVNWRVHITKLHSIVEKAMMIAPAPVPYEMNITLVTCLLDVGRDSLGDDAYQFRRDFKMYLDAMQEWLKHKYKKVVYTSKEIADILLKDMCEECKASTKFVYTNREELRTKWIGVDNYEKIQEIRTSKEWIERASWLGNSPQAGLKDYNALVMSKMYMMRDAARQNLWGTTHFVFFDAKHNCRRVDMMHDKNDHIMRAHMVGKLLLTTFDYTPASEVHGFEYQAFNRYCNMQRPEERQLVRVGRGGIFGGSAFVLEYITAMYDVALTATLREGLMGTEENVLSIVKYQVPQYVDEFSNNWACPEKVEKDHYCESQREHQGYNCAIIDWMARDGVRV